MSTSGTEVADELDALRHRVAELDTHVAALSQALASARAGAGRYRILLDQSADQIFTLAPDGRCEYANQAFADALGVPVDAVIGRRIADLMAQPQADQYLAGARQILQGADSLSVEISLPELSAHRYFVAMLKPLTDDARRVVAVICVCREVTERKRAEAELKAREKRFLELSSMSSDWFWVQDEQFRFTEFFGAFASGFTPPKESYGKTRWELNVDLTPAQWAEHRATLEAHLPFRNFEYPIVGANGEQRWYSINGSPLFDDDGRFIGYHGTGRNITAYKLAEQELRVAATAFESQEGVIVTDSLGMILRVNRAFARITGHEATEAVGQTPHMLDAGRHDAAFVAEVVERLRDTGSWQGEISCRRKSGDVFPAWFLITAVKDDSGKTTHYVATFTDITARKLAEDEINSLAFYDPLTGLPNRRLLVDRLKQALSASNRCTRNGALLFIDLDDFKALNDTLGHDIGDLLLQSVAERLRACVRESDTVARLGGDEFLVMLADLSDAAQEAAAQARSVGEKILACLNQPYQLAGYQHASTPSIGITLFAGFDGTVDELLKQADLAMYQAKASGRNTLMFFDPAMQATVSARVELEAGLREAIREAQFLLYYQVQVGRHGNPIGAEALLRWQHPQRGLVSPLEFISLAEATGLILPIGSWVLETACRQLAAWADHAETAHLSIAVNVSARQFHHQDFVAQVLAALDMTGADPRRLKLELTESLLVADVEDVIDKMTALKARGVGFSLDDFGTGYSSLAYLKRLPLDQLKIDQSFVRDILDDPNDAAIARMVVALADSLGLDVIAEGVETEAQRALLLSLGCPACQGYLFGKPLPPGAFESTMRRL